jgi:hypothetical protein
MLDFENVHYRAGTKEQTKLILCSRVILKIQLAIKVGSDIHSVFFWFFFSPCRSVFKQVYWNRTHCELGKSQFL